MTSPSSGYVTMRGNLSHDDPDILWGSVPVPSRNTVVVSFKDITSHISDVSLYRNFHKFDHATNHCREMQTKVWRRRFSTDSDFAYISDATKLSLQVERKSCIRTRCFQLFFTFLPESSALHRLPSGLWNCSVEHYSSFRHHMECNLKTECEDGRDEAGHCPFSSPDCQGMIALCGRCYSFVRNLPGFNSYTIQVNKVIDDHCRSLGGRVSLPLCGFDWFGKLLNVTGMHREKLSDFWVGMLSNDMSSPAMYRHEVFQDKVVLYHAFPARPVPHYGKLQCYYTESKRFMSYAFGSCVINYYNAKYFNGTLCAFTTNRTGEQSLHAKAVLLNNTQFVWSWRRQPVTLCRGGHVTYTFLLCGFHHLKSCSQDHSSCHVRFNLSHHSQLYSAGQRTVSLPTFTCSGDGTALSYSLVCNVVYDCQDSSDESFCQHPVCINSFTCINGQCLSYSEVCDQIPHCQDHSEEHSCSSYRTITIEYPFFYSSGLVNFDGIRRFNSTPMHSNESCPDSHYRCPGDFSDCLPVYTRCNGIHDCADLKDEEGCGKMMCSGFFRCRASTTCIHTDHLCDDWPHCPMRDDEIVCGASCPVGCLCQGHTFFCPQPFSVTQFPYIRSLDATSSGMTLTEVSQLTYLIHLVLARCSLTTFPHTKMSNLKFLDLSENKLKQVNTTAFLALDNLQTLSLSHNPITSLYTDLSSIVQHNNLLQVDLSFTALTVFDSAGFSPFVHTKKLNLTFTTIHTIGPSGFQFTPQLTELYMDGSPVSHFPLDMFKDLVRLRVISTENYKICCKQILPSKFDDASCHAPKDEISSCEDLLQSWFYRAFLWLISCLSMSGNMFCFSARLLARNGTPWNGFSLFVLNLTLADFLMGVYTAIIGVADERFRGRYMLYDDIWKSSITCKVAGSLSLLSSEVSALIIWLITLDRFLVLHFPFSTVRFGRRSASVACLGTWFSGLILALTPSLPSLSHWEFYSQTGICIPLPVSRHNFKGRAYSFSLLIVLNFILFLVISAGQALIYWSIQNNAFKNQTTKISRDMTIAQRLIIVAVTDFMCWFPIGVCGMLALAGIPIPGEVNVALAVFILPLNSAVNPFMYTFNALAEKRRRSHETKLLQWLESHSDTISS